MTEDSLYMDRACKVFIIVGAIVLFVMLISENGRSAQSKPPPPTTRGTGSTCGAMRASAPDQGGASAKRAGGGVGLAHGRTHQAANRPDPEADYVSLSESWMNDSVKACEHEMVQDEAALRKAFTWDANSVDPSVNEKFEALAISEEDVKKKANIHAAGPNTMAEQPTQAKRLGMTNPMHAMYHKNGVQDVEFGSSCSWFHASDAYYDARRRLAKCDCLNEDCDKC